MNNSTEVLPDTVIFAQNIIKKFGVPLTVRHFPQKIGYDLRVLDSSGNWVCAVTIRNDLSPALEKERIYDCIRCFALGYNDR